MPAAIPTSTSLQYQVNAASSDHALPHATSSPAPLQILSQKENNEESLSRAFRPAANLPHTPRRYSPYYPAGDTVEAISPVVLDIERRLFTPERSSSRILPHDSSETVAEYACQDYSPRPDDFYFDDGLGGHVVKLELPESDRELLSAEEFLADIRKIEEAIEVSCCTAFIPISSAV